jgi:hypothetical protein
MSAKSMFMMGLLSIIAATGLFGVSNGVAADVDIRSHNKGVTATTGSDDFDVDTSGHSEGVTATRGSDDVKMPENRASQLQVVDSEGNVYLLIPLDKHGKASVEYMVPYTNPTSH